MVTMTTVELIAGLVIVVGIVGVVIPVLPGVLLVAGALLGWAIDAGTSEAWLWAGVALAVLGVGQVFKYLVPGRRLAASGVPNRTILIGGAAAIVGFFVVPVVGLFLGFLGGVYAAEVARLGQQAAWTSTWAATKAVGLAILIELMSVLVAGVLFVAALLAT